METDSSLSLVHQMQTTKKIAASVPHHFFPYFVIILIIVEFAIIWFIKGFPKIILFSFVTILGSARLSRGNMQIFICLGAYPEGTPGAKFLKI
ncbi:hypothetical protein T08_14840 [Trichinella sp. T8]|nr:hypothetical protein T08_14840 [Trichinella sp. T8]